MLGWRSVAVSACVLLGIVSCSDAGSNSIQPGQGSAGPGGSSGAGGSTQGGSAGVPSTSGAPNTSGSGNGMIKDDGGSKPNADAFWAEDPPPMQCGGDGGMMPVVPGGTPECPDDKNREGCPCPTAGAEAPCWPGLRKNRNRGICKDGVATCKATGEVGAVWGECKGYVLPNPTATVGAAACQCFSSGKWAIANLSPCFVNNGDAGAVSTFGNPPMCPMISGSGPTLPAEAWSKNSLTVDCAGHFKLCYTLKAGSAMNPSPNDCKVVQVCTEADYLEAGKEQPFPDLGGWVTTTNEEKACASSFAKNGGYGEMSVIGLSIECDEIPDHVFNRVQYCPLKCAQNPNDPDCVNCQAGGSGSF
jgi:hypothetical protein